MTARSTQELIESLARELRPVQPIAPLRHPAAALAAGWTLLALLLVLWPGAAAVGSPGFLPVFLASASLAAGALCAALAMCIPGREATVWAGYGVCGLAIVSIAVLVVTEPATFPRASLSYLANQTSHDWICVGISTVLGLPFLALVLAFGRSGFVVRHWAVAAYAGVGSVSCGAMLVHAVCAEGCAQHALGSHALAPIWGAPLLLIPAYLTLRRRHAEGVEREKAKGRER